MNALNKKNIVFLLIDSFWYGYLNNNSLGVPVMPFLDEVSKNWLVADNVYSSGPYTEAGIRGVLNGIKDMDNGGYYLQLGQEDDNYIKLFYENGYEIFDHIYPNYLLSKKSRDRISHPIYVRGISFKSIWDIRCKCFYDDYDKLGSLSEQQYKELQNLLKAYIESLKDVFETHYNNPDAFAGLSKQIEGYDFDKNYTILLSEELKIINNPRKYINRIMEEKDENALWKIEEFDNKSGVNYECISEQLNCKFRSQLKLIQTFSTLFKSDLDYIKAMQDLIKFIFCRNPIYKEYIGSIKRTLEMVKDYDVYNQTQEFTYGTSLYRQCQIALSQLKKRDESKPFFYSIKSEELHYFHRFCSVDCWDRNLIKEEISEMRDFIQSAKKWKIKGCLSGYLAAHYTDMCIKKFYYSLDKEGLLKDTVIVISADHGSSFSATPIRNKPIMNFYDENYHVPILIGGGGTKAIHDSTFHMSRDLLPTLVEICNLEKQYNMSGISILSCDKQEEVLIEHLGPGYPDLFNKDVWFSARNKKYAVSYKVKLKNDFSEGSLISVFDLEKDPKELNNLLDKVRFIDIGILLNLIENRHEQLRSRYKDLMKCNK